MKLKSIARFVIALLVSILIAGVIIPSAKTDVSAATPVYHNANVTSASSGNTMVRVDGTFDTTATADILALINQYRYEACNAGNVPDPRNTSRMLQPSDYVPIKWSNGLEEMAMLRAVEGDVYWDHTRPNGQSCFTASYSVSSNSENLAWNYGDGILSGMAQWYDEMSAWVNQTGEVTGHYTSMINPNNRYYGCAYFRDCLAGEFSRSTSNLSQTRINVGQYSGQYIEVKTSMLENARLVGDNFCAVGGQLQLTPYVNFTPSAMQQSYLYYFTRPDIVMINGSWSTSSSTVATVSNGLVTGRANGTTTITFAGAKTVSSSVSVLPVKYVLMDSAGDYTFVDTTAQRDSYISSGYQYEGMAFLDTDEYGDTIAFHRVDGMSSSLPAGIRVYLYQDNGDGVAHIPTTVKGTNVTQYICRNMNLNSVACTSTVLQRFDAAHNNLSENSVSFPTSTTLRFIDISYNNFTTVPGTFNPVTLNASNNNLTGFLDFSDRYNLRNLILDNNHLCGLRTYYYALSTFSCENNTYTISTLPNTTIDLTSLFPGMQSYYAGSLAGDTTSYSIMSLRFSQVPGTVTYTYGTNSSATATFTLIAECSHNIVHYDAASSTCTAQGHSAYDQCSNCGVYFVNGVAQDASYSPNFQPMLAHNIQSHDAVAATCTTQGMPAYYQCTSCNQYFTSAAGSTTTSAPVAIRATGHSIVTHAAVAATCTSTGMPRYYQCSRCNNYFTGPYSNTTTSAPVATPRLAHSIVTHNAVAATCTTTGMPRYYQCSRCNGYFTSTSGTTSTSAPVAIPATGHSVVTHNAVAATCTSTGMPAYYQCSRCNNYFTSAAGTTTTTAPVATSRLAHTIVTHNAVAATCTTAGMPAYYQCSACNQYFTGRYSTTTTSAPTPIAPLGHSIVTHARIEATCTTSGMPAYYQCSRCNGYFTSVAGTASTSAPVAIPAAGHSIVTHSAMEATCTTPGMPAYYQCSRCNIYYTSAAGTTMTTAPVAIPAIGHSTEHHDRVEATTEASGNVEYWYCTVCHGYYLDAACLNATTAEAVIIPRINSNPNPGPEPGPQPDPEPDPGDGINMYRLFNPNSGEHFYTGSQVERDNLVSAGWNYEGVAWIAPTSGTPVYRVFNPNNGDHHYTPSELERDNLIAAGWNYEGIGWYSAPSTGTPLYRLYNPNCTGAGSHHYTSSSEERDYLVSVGWNYEGIGWYGA